MSNNNSSVVQTGHASTLLIPESVVWLPYAGLVVTVIVWLGLDFYKFHKKNKQKYRRIEETQTIVRSVPKRQRISMVSGIGLRFRRGKPVLGDVWNTSPSSSDLSSCYSPVLRRDGPLSYSREVTPSSDEGAYTEGEVFTRSNSFLSSDCLTADEEGEEKMKGWELGGELLKGPLDPTDAVEGQLADKSQESYGFAIMESKGQGEGQGDSLDVPMPISVISSTATILAPTVEEDEQQEEDGRIVMVTGAGGGVDDGGGGAKVQSPRQDACTQTSFPEVVMDINSGERVEYASHHSHPPVTPRHLTSAHRRHRHSIAVDSGTPHHFGRANHDHLQRPCYIDFSSPRSGNDGRSGESPTSPGTLKSFSERSDKRVPSLKLDLLSAPYSPTTEIVATKHGFVVEGIEVPHFPGGGGRSLPTSSSDIFKQPEGHNQGHPFIKPLNPSPAITARVPTQRPVSPRHPTSSSHRSDHHHADNMHHSYSYHAPPQPQQQQEEEEQTQKPLHPQHQEDKHKPKHQARRRPDNLKVSTSKGSPSKTSPIVRKPSTHSSRSVRAVSSSPRMIKEWDDSTEQLSVKAAKDSGQQSPQTAPIPQHLYHQDEEGFFASSSHLSVANARRGFDQEGGDNSRKGILFFSRLSGAGRQPGTGGGGSPRRKNNGSGYKTGGFES